jgi:ribosomal protein L9
MVENKKAVSLTEKKGFIEALERAISKLENAKLIITGKTNEKGHLFAGVHKEQIALELKKQTGFDLPSDCLELEKPLKEIGESKIKITAFDFSRLITIEIKNL